MSANRDREEEIFDAARELAAERRAAYLAERCGQDANLRQRIEEMLAADAAAGEFFKTHGAPSPTVIHADASLSPSIEKPGDRIGGYKLLQQIGEGGMGRVYMAEQDKPVRRLVALKIIKFGMDTRQVVARFEAERQALAMMDHPHIAKIFDAGATDSGRPYFVMELVRGIPITEYCDKNLLPTRQRLDLFVLVCQAVQHAHQKGVIHRDLKPSNILVTFNDGVPWPMVIDFGIAKATNQRLTEKTLFTDFAQMIGTPAYMSPEQAEMSKLDVDTRTDIYALGVLLYELLTGAPPFSTRELLSLGYREMQRTIAEKEPPRLSTRLSTMANEERTVVAKNRSVEVSALAGLFRGDLDWIAMKCLEKDRSRRYETVNGLARDVQRHLQNEPVAARPPSQLYRFQKAYRRNRLAFSAAALVFASMVIAIIGIAMAARRENRARIQESRQRAVSVQLRQRAETGELTARLRAYASDINLAQQALDGGALGRAQRLLDEAGDSGMRGWEWRYLWKQSRSEALSTLFTVSGCAYSVKSSADGRWLATMDSSTARVHVWDRMEARSVAELPGQESGVVWPVFGPLTSILAYFAQLESRTNEVGLVIWDPVTRKKIVELPTGPVAGISFRRDEKMILTCSWSEATVLGWELPGGRLVTSNSFKGFPGLVRDPAYFFATGDAATVVLDDGRGNRCIRDLNTGKALWEYHGPQNYLWMQLSPDDRVLAVGPNFKGGPIVLYEMASGEELGRLEGNRNAVRGLAFWPDGKRLAAAGFDQTIRIWDIHDLASVPPPRVLLGHKRAVWGIDVLPDARTLVSSSMDGEICLWDSGAESQVVPSSHHSISNILSWTFSTDSRSMLSTDLTARELVERSLDDGAEKHASMAFEPGAAGACWSPDGSSLAVGSTNGSVQVWELPARSLRGRFIADTHPALPLQFHQDGRQLALMVDNDPDSTRFEIWEPSAGQRLLSRLLPTEVELGFFLVRRGGPFQLSPDLAKVFSFTGSVHNGLKGTLQEQRAFLWSPADDQRLDLGPFDESSIKCVAFSPDGKLVAVSGASEWTWVWDAHTGRLLAKFSGFLIGASGITFTPDSKRLVVGGGAEAVCKIWDVETWRELLSVPCDGGWFHEVKFSPDGNVLGARTDQSSLQSWRAPSWEQIAKAK